MATISVTIPDQVVNRVLDAFAVQYGYDANSGLTKSQFAKQQVANIIKAIVVNHEANQAASDAYNTKNTSSSSEITIS